MVRCLKQAGEMGYRRIYLESFPHFGRAVRLYEKLGFRPLNGPMGNSGHTSCTIWMIKDV